MVRFSFEDRELLNQALADDIIDIDDVRKKVEMKKRTEILKQHKYAITQGKDGCWRTYLPDPTKPNKRKQIKKSSKEKIENVVIEYYEKAQKKESMTIEQLYPEWLKYYSLHTEAEGTVKRVNSDWKKYYVNDPLVKTTLEKISKVQLDKWVHQMVKVYQMTKTQYYNMSLIIRKMMIYAKESGYISENPFSDVKVNSKLFFKKKKPEDATQVYTVEEEIAIVEEAWKDYQNNPENVTPLAVILMFYLGVRIGEVVAFKDIDIKGNSLDVARMERRMFDPEAGYRQKGRKVVEHAKTSAGSRTIYLVKDARTIINILLEAGKKNGYTENYYLFMNRGERIYDSGVRWRVEKYCKHLGIAYRSPHKIRKTYISKLIDDKVNINTIRELVGHESERTTYRSYCYSRKTETQTQEQLEQTLKIDLPDEYMDNIVPFVQNPEEKKVIKGNQNITA
ncbi:tyrosine-type recombinase/integrase [Faecalicatena contorta]|uniref:tyrosine-type recombinase/integrase n=1 Tax=Faecalicatena contorta TaxID=39482 RepID=UPI001F3663EC|nr:tyrosine-type recombinase/integrase [Faecalicatena contorta]MCF2679785.1 tyrosine-type recombinase/integrase [Faecalicatena contorta]